MENKSKLVSAIVVIVVILAFALGLVYLFTRNKNLVSGEATNQSPVAQSLSEAQNTNAAQTATNMPQASNTNGLKIEDEKVGTGTEAVAGKSVTVNYVGTLLDGTKFDSSYDRNQPFTFNLGAGEVIKGWDQGVAGMKIGGKRKLTIPADLGYGAAGAPPVIPPNATLVFEVELLEVK